MYNPFDLTGKNIIITGASSGIGRECAIACSKMGATVNIVGRNEYRLSETLKMLEGDKHQMVAFDVTDFNNIEKIVSSIVNSTGKVSGFIHSAGIQLTKPLRMTKSEDYENIFKVNVISAFEFSRVITKKKYCADSASIVFIASIMGVVGTSGMVAYGSSKSALINGVKTLALELAKRKIRFNAISSAIIKTSMAENMFSEMEAEQLRDINNKHPLGFGSPQDVANGCVYLLSDSSKWVTGTNLIVDGGYSAQ